MDKLKSLLVYFLKNSPRLLGRTDLMKFVYCFEYYYVQMYGRPFTDIEFKRYYYGPNEASVIEATFSLHQEGVITINEYPNYYGTLSYDHAFHPESNHRMYEDLPADAEFIAGFIVDQLGNKNYKGVIDFAYSTPPMRDILEEEKVVGRECYGRVLDMSKTGPVFKSTRKQKEEARQRLRENQLTRGSDSEYYDHLMEQYRRFEDTRRRANLVESDIQE